MSFLSAIPIIGDLFKSAVDLASEAITDKDKKNELVAQFKMYEADTKRKILEMNNAELLAQAQINLEASKSNDSYVRRARPTILWICGGGMAWSCLIHPMLSWVWPLLSIRWPELKLIDTPPNIDMAIMLPVLMGMLGLSGLRTFEKREGIKK